MFTAKVGEEHTEDDAIDFLRHVLYPDMYPDENARDYTGDGKVTEDDAIYLLFVLLILSAAVCVLFVSRKKLFGR